MNFFLLCFLSTTVFAWGPTGHRTVGEIAEKNLNPQVRLQLKKILDGQSLARVSTWPDEIKSDPANFGHTFKWHYTEWSDQMRAHSEKETSGLLISSINEHMKTLKDKKATKEKRAFALKFLVHLIGDLHMPLHVGNGQDRGGNTCMVTFHDRPMNLHSLWDEGLIEFTQLSFTELADFVSQGKKSQDEGIKLLDWAQESRDIRKTIYPHNPEKYCKKEGNIPVAEMPKLSFDYSYKFFPIIEDRLYLAGIRLARILNECL